MTETTTTGLRAQVGPHAAIALLTVAAAATHAAGELTGDQAVVALSVAGTAVVLAVLVATRLGQRITCRKARARLRAFLAVAAAWLTTVTVTGLSLGAVGLLAAMVYAISMHWWRAKRIANPAPTAAPAVVDVDAFAKRWATYLGGQGCVLAGSRLIQPEPIDAGVRYVLQMVPGKHTYDGVLAALSQVRNGLRVRPGQDVIVEQHPELDESYLRLTIVTRSPIVDSVEWPGPAAFDSATGCMALGPYADGIGTATWRVYGDNSMWGGYLSGSSGSGKSRMFESLALSLAAAESHPTVVMFADGDEGASSPMLAQHADYFAPAFDDGDDVSRPQAMLAGALLLMRLRRAENVAYGWEGFTPTVERPGVMIFIDECHVIFADEACRLMAAEIARRGRKVGVNIIAASQIATMEAFGGAGMSGAEVLRSSLRAGNAVILRSTTSQTKTVFGVDIDPTKFPDLPGYAYYVAHKGSSARTAPFRGYYLDSQARDYWAPRIQWRSLDQGEGNAWGNDYAQRKATAAATRDEALARIAAAKAGYLPLPAAGGLVVRGGDGARSIPAPRFPVAQFPVWTPPAAPARPELTESQRAVVDAIKAGADAPGAISEATGLSRRQVHNLLDELYTAGQVSKPSYGRYALAA